MNRLRSVGFAVLAPVIAVAIAMLASSAASTPRARTCSGSTPGA